MNDDKPNELLSIWDIAAINAARSVLNEISIRCSDWESQQTGWRRDHELQGVGIARGQAEAAEHSLFQVLNTTKHFLGEIITDDQLHNRNQGIQEGV